MIIKQDLSRHELPEHVETHSTRLFIYPAGDPQTNPNSPAYAINHVSPAEIYLLDKEQSEIRGQPVIYSIVHGPDVSSLRLHPAPDRPYFAKFRYCPAAKEI